MKKFCLLALPLSLALSACAPDPDEAIIAKFVSTQKYAAYNCQRLIQENNRIAKKLTHMHAYLKKKGIDEIHTGYSLFWGSYNYSTRRPEAEDFGLLKGQYEAIQLEAASKKCDRHKMIAPHFEKQN